MSAGLVSPLPGQICFLRCVHCHAVLTRSLRPLGDATMLCQEDGQDIIPRGAVMVSDGSFFRGTEGQFIVNPKDLLNTRHHSDHRRLNGCCGLDGCDGKNTVCVNGHEVGTERSDCWMPHAIHFDLTAVEIVVGEPGTSRR